MPQLRQNIITGEWVVIAPERAKRPQDFVIPKSVKVADPAKCPFCVGSDGYKSNEKVRRASTENIYVIENKYPAFVDEEIKTSLRSYYPEKGFYRARPSVGRHEVVIVKDHDKNLYTLGKELTLELLEVIQDRYLAIKKIDGIASILPIYNHGAEAGASIVHPHAQIFASGIVANSINDETTGADKYFGINGACVFCDIIKHELREKVRVVYENEDYLAATFFAARFPFETWVYPKKHESQFEETSKSSLASLADCLSTVLKKIDKTLENPPLNMYIHTLPTIDGSSETYHWHIEIAPRVSNFGGFELGSDVSIDVMAPEEAAEYLRQSEKENNVAKTT